MPASLLSYQPYRNDEVTRLFAVRSDVAERTITAHYHIVLRHASKVAEKLVAK